jgi:hypothetical protein
MRDNQWRETKISENNSSPVGSRLPRSSFGHDGLLKRGQQMNMQNIQMLFFMAESIIALAPWRIAKRRPGSERICLTGD